MKGAQNIIFAFHFLTGGLGDAGGGELGTPTKGCGLLGGRFLGGCATDVPISLAEGEVVESVLVVELWVAVTTLRPCPRIRQSRTYRRYPCSTSQFLVA